MARITRKASAAPLNRFRITSPDLPGAIFGSIPDLYEFAPTAAIAQTAIDEFRVHGCKIPLIETLRDQCCWDADAITAVIKNPRVTPPIYYGWPADYGMHPVEPSPAPVKSSTTAVVTKMVDSALAAARGLTSRPEMVAA
jgi:hypothetical protein